MPKSMRSNFLLFIGLCIFLMTIGCQGTRVAVVKEPSPAASPAYKKGGPPPWAPAHGYRAKYKYRYYPSSGVYFEIGRGVYFYYRDGRWKASVSLPSNLHLNFKEYISLEMDTDKPYEWHHEVIKRYPPGQQKKLHKKKGKGNRNKN